MSTPAPRSRRRPRVPASGAAAPRQPVDRAEVGRGSARWRATGMTATEAAAALDEARLHRHLDRDREDLADDERGPAEVAEWDRITQLLAITGGTYDPESDAAVQDELAAEAAAAAAEAELRDLELEQERQEWLHSNGLPERARWSCPGAPDHGARRARVVLVEPALTQLGKLTAGETEQKTQQHPPDPVGSGGCC
ncbi:hypothetical protein ACFVXX_39585, partial [Streptomyces sp. NPDC058258]